MAFITFLVLRVVFGKHVRFINGKLSRSHFINQRELNVGVLLVQHEYIQFVQAHTVRTSTNRAVPTFVYLFYLLIIPRTNKRVEILILEFLCHIADGPIR